MIFVTSNEAPLFRAYVNGIHVKELDNGGEITTLILGTSGNNLDGSKKYSSWFANVIGQARKDFETNPLKKGDVINVYSFKQENVSKKNEDGSFGKPFFTLAINNYELYQSPNDDSNYAMLEDSPF